LESDDSLEKRLENRRILLGVTGSIAAYKACEILRLLLREGAEVQVVMTSAAQRFVAPLSFETLSAHEVITELFPDHRVVKTRHVSVTEWAECILICPATANIVGKVASGIADDFLTTAVMASRSPVVFAPAMDFRMVQNPIYISNCEKLTALGYRFVSPESGELASGAKGLGRLAEPHRILASVKSVLLGTDRLKGKKVLVTAGPTREFLDPVRYLTNRSSGKMGYALAEEAVLRGAEVALVSGPTNLTPFEGIRVERVQTAEEMARVVFEEWKRQDVLIMAAAVADYRPCEVSHNKIKKDSGGMSLRLEKTTDILKKAASEKGKRVVVGFALETEDGEARARRKLTDKNLNLICLNNPLEAGSGFDADTNKVTLINKDGTESLPLLPKWAVAQKILDRVEGFLV
jgi:phosphopantothenoylcysteine decarboxylase/phosphopantothenate--cysteine ligase